MSLTYTIDTGYTRPVTTINLAIPSFDKSEWAEMPWTDDGSTPPKGQLQKQFTNTTAPEGRPCILKLWRNQWNNIYSKYAKLLNINPFYQSPVKTGLNIGSQFANVDKITDASGNAVYVPWSSTIQLNFTLHEAIDATYIKAKLCDQVDQMFPTGSVSANQLGRFAKGSFEYIDETTP